MRKTRDLHGQLPGIYETKLPCLPQTIQRPAKKAQVKCRHMSADNGFPGCRITKKLHERRIDFLLGRCSLQDLIRDVIQCGHFRQNAGAGIDIALEVLRCDSILYNQQAQPKMIIEYKAPHIDISQKTFDQLAVYNLKLNVNKFIVTNGLTHYCGEIDAQNASYRFFEEIPAYDEL